MHLKLLKFFNNRLGLKIFSIFTFFILITSFSFTVFFFHHESKSLTDTLIENNLLLTTILAYNSRVGVFSENKELLRENSGGAFQQKETMEVCIYDLNGRLLTRQKRFGKADATKLEKDSEYSELIKAKVFDKFRNIKSPVFFDNKNTMEFWAPVLASSSYATAESLIIENELLPKEERIIGFVKITVGKSTLNKSLAALLLKSILIGVFFLIIGSGFMYFTINRIVNPLKTLTKSVHILGKGALSEKVPVETEDEVGKLAMAFNEMSESLMKREIEKDLLEERLVHAKKMEAVGTLAGGIAHDFNNILGIIMGYVQMAILYAPPNNDIHRYLREISKAGKRASDLVSQILAFSRQNKQARTPLLIKPIVDEVLQMMHSSLPATIKIRHNFETRLSLVLSDSIQIHQVLMNLCTNAAHAMQEIGGILEVNLDERFIDGDDSESPIDIKPGRYQILTISDTGCGIDDTIMKRIFDPFFTTKGPGKGTGLGLSVVHGIVKSHGGKIKCRSEIGKGTTFDIFFPVISDE